MVVNGKPESRQASELDAALLTSNEFRAFLGTIDSATTIIGSTDQTLREADAGITSREFDALVFITAFGPIRPSELLRRVVMTHSELLRKSQGPEYVEATENLKVYIQRLRRKIEEDPAHPKLILTERGVGYIFTRH